MDEKWYWPCCIIQNKDERRARMQITYDSVGTIAEARKIIDAWRADNNVLVAWIDGNNAKAPPVWFDVYADNFGGAYEYQELDGTDRQ